MLSGNNAWTRNNFTDWRSSNNNFDTGFGIWRANLSIHTYTNGAGENGNYANIYFGTSSVGANPPTSNPDSDPQFHIFRTYLGTDAANSSPGTPAPPAKPYLDQTVTAKTGPNPPHSGQTSRVTVTIRLVNPIPSGRQITFDSSYSTLTSSSRVVVGALPGDGRVLYVGGSAATNCGTVASQPSGGATSGNIIWTPGAVSGGTTCLFVYDLDVTPTSAGQTINVTRTPSLNTSFSVASGTRAQFLDQTQNASQSRATNTLGPICNVTVQSNNLTRALVTSFHSFDDRGGRAVEWTTTTEDGTSGFYLYRLEAGRWRLVTPDLVPADPRALAGATYRVVDPGGSEASTYSLLEVESSGKSNSYGPFPATPPVTESSHDVAAPLNLSVSEPAWDLDSGDIARRATPAPASELVRLRAARRERRADLRQAAASPSFGPPVPGRLGPRAAIHVAEPGPVLVRVDAASLAAAFEVPQSAVESALQRGGIALTEHGNPVGWTAADDGSALYFVGVGPRDGLEQDNVYRAALAAGRPMDVRSVGPASIGRSPGSFDDAVDTEQDSFALLTLPLDPASDLWFWDYLATAEANPDVKEFTLTAPDVDVSAPARLDVRLFGYSTTGVEDEHQVDVLLNGHALGTLSWTGLTPETGTLDVPAEDLLPDGNVVELQGTTGDGAPYSTVFLDGFTLHYRRALRASGDVLLFSSGPAGSGMPPIHGRRPEGHIQPLSEGPTVSVSGFDIRPARGGAAMSVSGFDTSDLLLLDVTAPDRATRLVGASEATQPDATTSLGFQDALSGRRYLASSLAAAHPPASVEADFGAAALDRLSGAAYVVIAPRELAAGAAELADRRAGQGLSTMVVSTDTIYDHYSSGVQDPRAIARFLADAYAHWTTRPRYVVLVGGGTYDLRDRLGLGGNLIPPDLQSTDSGVVATDARLGDVNGDGFPEMAVGRIPVADAAELDGYLQKLAAYEDAGAQASNRAAVLLTDNGSGPDTDFAHDGDQVQPRLSPDLSVDRIDLGALGTGETRTELLGSFQTGLGFLDYFGHGGVNRLADEGLLTTDDVPTLTNLGRTPLFTAMTCSINRYELAGIPSLGADLTRSASGGAIAVWAPAGQSKSIQALALGKALADEAFHSPDQRLGDLLLVALQRYRQGGGDGVFASLYVLLGDPATRLQVPPPVPTSGGTPGPIE